MKLVLHCSNTSNAAAAAVIEALGKQNTNGSQHIFIVPDRFSLSFEREIFERLSLPGAANIDVVSFMRLAVRELKGKIGGTLTKQGATLVFKRAIDKNTDKLVRYSRAARSMSFAKEMFAVVASLRSGGYTPQDLLDAKEHLHSSTISKAQDIALLYDAYLKELETGYEDATSRIEKLAKHIDDSQWIKASCVYIAGFHSFTAKEYAVIERLIQTAKSVDIALTPSNGRANSDRYPSAVLERLKAIASDINVTPKICEQQVDLPKPFSTLNGELFTYSAVEEKNDTDRVRLYKENTVYEEANGIAREILRLVRNGYRFKDVAIVNSNSAYQDIFASIFTRYDIPFFIDRKYYLKNMPAATFIVSAAEVQAFNYRADKVLQFIKNPLFGLSDDSSDLFENYILKYNINYNGFLSPFTYDENAEAIRQKLVELLANIAKHTYWDFADSLDALLSQAETNFQRYLEEIKEEETLYASNSLSFDKVKEILSEIKELLGRQESRIEEQIDTLKSSIAASEISIIPQFADGVFIGSLRESRYENLKAIFVVSASAGMLPSEQGYRAIISAADSDMLEESGIRLYPTPLDLIREEEFLILDLLTKAENFYIGYSAFTPSGEALSPSYVIKELSAILNKEPTSINKRFELIGLHSEKELVYGAASYKNAYFQYLSYVKRIPKSDNLRINLLSGLYAALKESEQDKANKLIFEVPDNFIPSKDLYFKRDSEGAYLTSVSQIENYFSCPYKHHLTYGIALKEREAGEIRAVDIGIIIHKALELYFKQTLGKLRVLSEAELDGIAVAAIEQAIDEEGLIGVSLDPQMENILKNIQRNSFYAIKKITQNILLSRFEPKYIEQSFGYGGGFLAISIIDESGNLFKLRGKIDRIDVCDKKAAVIDIKTGKAKPSYTELYYGEKVQLYIYLRALEEKGLEPSGAFYLPIHDSYSQDGAAYQMVGFFDEQAKDDFDTTVSALTLQHGRAKSEHIDLSLRRTKDGEVATYPQALFPITKNKLKEYIDYAYAVTGMGLSEISSGYIAKSPLFYGSEKTACSICQYKNICLGEGKQREKLSSTVLIKSEKEDE